MYLKLIKKKLLHFYFIRVYMNSSMDSWLVGFFLGKQKLFFTQLIEGFKREK